MKEIKAGDITLARLIKPEDIKGGLNFYSQENEYIQAGVWSYEEGRVLQPHIHNIVERRVERTCEVLYVIEGALEASIFDLDEQPVETIRAEKGDILILLECGHGYRILKDPTRVLEVKNGPYLGADTDRRRI